MADILFVTWDGGGNLSPTLGIAHELAGRGHAVRFLGHRRQADRFAREGLAFTAYPTAHDFDVADPKPPLGVLKVFTDRALGRDVAAALAAQPADLVVVDCFLFAAMAALRDAGVPYVTLEHSLDRYLRAAARGPLGLLVRMRGLAALALVDAGTSVVVPALPSLDAGHAPHVRHTGPVVSGVPAAAAEPTVLVSLSTVGFPALTKTWQRVLDAVDGLPARVVVTTGPSLDISRLRVPAGVEVHAWLPHAEVMPYVSAVVTHGGHGTAMAALAHDLPMLVVPLDTKTDQPLMGKVLAASGAALTLGRRSSPDKLRTAITSLLGDGPHREAAARLGAEVRAMRGPQTAAEHLEALLRNGAAAPGRPSARP